MPTARRDQPYQFVVGRTTNPTSGTPPMVYPILARPPVLLIKKQLKIDTYH